MYLFNNILSVMKFLYYRKVEKEAECIVNKNWLLFEKLIGYIGGIIVFVISTDVASINRR